MAYTGPSAVFRGLQEDYFTYANEVNTERALPDVRDGLKPVHRRILETGLRHKVYDIRKSSFLASSTTADLHPHGDGAVYEAAVLMTDSNGSWNVPLLHGQGTLGKVYTGSASPAASRYTEMCLTKFTRDHILCDYDLLTKRQTPIGDGQVEAEALAPHYPHILTVGHEGMGVGVGTNIPPFNFWEVIALTEIYLKEGDFGDVYIQPDFPTGGSVLDDPIEAMKMMYTGKGKYTVRAKYSIQKNLIVITEVPYGTTDDKMVDAIKKMNHPDISRVSLASDIDGCKIIIICKRGSNPEIVEADLYRNNILQKTFTPYMLWNLGSEIYEGGVYPMIVEWAKHRKSVVEKSLKADLDSLKAEQTRLSYFIELIQDEPSRDIFIHKAVNVSTKDAKSYLVERFPEIPGRPAIPDEVCDWICKRAVTTFNKANAYAERYRIVQEEIEKVNIDLGDLNSVLIRDLENMKAEYKGKYLRRTTLSSTRIVAKKSKSKVEDPGKACEFVFNTSSGVITKQDRSYSATPQGAQKFSGNTQNTVLLGICTDGSIAKIWASNLEPDVPTSIYELCSLPDDAQLLAVIDPSKYEDQVLIHADGGISFWSPAEEISGRRTKRKLNALPPLDALIDMKPESEVDSVTWVYDYRGLKYMTAQINLTDRPKQSRTKSYPVGVLPALAEYYGFNVIPNHDVTPRVLGQNLSEEPDWDNVMLAVNPE